MPSGFHFPRRDAEIWTPMRFAPSDFEDRDNNYLHVVARLKDGVSLEQARAEMALVAAQLEREYPNGNARTGATVNRLPDELGAFAALAVLLAGVGIHGLLAFTVSSQTREIGVRLALGAQRRDVLAMVAGRGALWAALGTVLGVVLA